MKRKYRRKIIFIIGLVTGVLVDGYLRITSKDEGNLLVHIMIFLGGFLIATGVVHVIFYIWDNFLKRKIGEH